MASFNRIILVGNITHDLMVSTTPGGTTVCSFSMATNRKFRSKDNEQREEVCFVDCVLFGKSADTFYQYMEKGSQVLIEGRLTLDQWTDKESGNRRSRHKVMVDNFTFLGQRQERVALPVAPVEGVPSGDDIPF